MDMHFSYSSNLSGFISWLFVRLKVYQCSLFIVQGSGLGPSLFTVYAMDLKPLSDYNTILKYADDTSLLVPRILVTLQSELDWSQKNKLKVNTFKTK